MGSSKETAFLSPAFPPCANSKATNNVSRCQEIKVIVSLPASLTFVEANRRVCAPGAIVLVVVSGVMPGQPHENGRAILSLDEVSAIRKALLKRCS